jgi:hypothetical protein
MKNGTFEEIFEKLAKLENTQKEFLILSVEDRLIKFNDTPASIKLKTFHIIGWYRLNVFFYYRQLFQID